MAGSDMDGVKDVINRTTSDKVEISCRNRSQGVNQSCVHAAEGLQTAHL